MASKKKIESDKSGDTSKSMVEVEVEHNEDVDNVFSFKIITNAMTLMDYPLFQG